MGLTEASYGRLASEISTKIAAPAWRGEGSWKEEGYRAANLKEQFALGGLVHAGALSASDWGCSVTACCAPEKQDTTSSHRTRNPDCHMLS